MRGVLLRSAGLAVAGLTAIALGGGCDQDAAADPGRRLPAATAGQACELIEYDVVEAALGVRFEVAGGAEHKGTRTCALTGEAEYPDLVLSVSPTSADKVIFTATVVPSGAKALKDLGKTAYLALGKAAKGHGPSVEIGWLSDANLLLVLRFTLPESAAATEAEDITPKLTSLAQTVDQRLVR